MKKYIPLFAVAVSFIFLGAGCSNSAAPAYKATPVNTVPKKDVVMPQTQPTIDTQPVQNIQAPVNRMDVKIENFAFQTADLTVKAGTTVTWTNNDSVPHTVTANDGSFDSKTMAKGDTFSYTFTTPGNFLYICSFHRSMRGSVTVTE